MPKIVITYEYQPNLDHYPTGGNLGVQSGPVKRSDLCPRQDSNLRPQD